MPDHPAEGRRGPARTPARPPARCPARPPPSQDKMALQGSSRQPRPFASPAATPTFHVTFRHEGAEGGRGVRSLHELSAAPRKSCRLHPPACLAWGVHPPRGLVLGRVALSLPARWLAAVSRRPGGAGWGGRWAGRRYGGGGPVRAGCAAPAVPAAELLPEVRVAPRRLAWIGGVGTGLRLGLHSPLRHRPAGPSQAMRRAGPSPAALGCFTHPPSPTPPPSPG